MPEASAQDRLQPSLLDRLLDLDPRSRSEPAEARALSRQQLRAAVLRDLGWLFNAIRPEPENASDRADEKALWERFPDARRSVLNFGLPAFAGSTVSSMDTGAIRRAVADAIRQFEPRIEADTLDVDVNVNAGNHHNLLQITIKGRMWSQPMPLELLLAAEVDVETGNTLVRDLRA